jgi:hypothetical protein
MNLPAPRLSVPYPGLRPFEPEESPLFFGRGGHIAEMLLILRERHVLAVVGSSGSGKSSLVRAGLLPALEQGFLGDEGTWRFVVTRPGNDPYSNLASEFVRQFGEAECMPESAEVAFCRATLRRGPNGLLDTVADLLLPETVRLLLIVDQFEELFRFHNEGTDDDNSEAEKGSWRNEALAFVDLLLSTVGARHPQVYLALTMRSDYLGNCDAFRGLPETISRCQFLPPRLTREELRDAIERPAVEPPFQGRIMPDVTSRLIAEMGDRNDQLPLIQHALLAMWHLAENESGNADSSSGPMVTVRQYDQIGGAASALNLHADDIFLSLKSDQQREIVRRLFCALCASAGAGRRARRFSSISEVAGIARVDPAEVLEVVAEFACPGVNFLVTYPVGPATADSNLDISHESLIRHWRRLNDWLKQEAESASRYRHLVESARLYASGQEELLDGRALESAVEWFDRERPTSLWGDRYAPGEFAAVADYLRLSREHEQQQQARHERIRQQDEERRDRIRRLLAPSERHWRTIFRQRALVAILLAAAVPNLMASVFNTVYNLKGIVERLDDAESMFWFTQITVNSMAFPFGLGLLALLCMPVVTAATRREKGFDSRSPSLDFEKLRQRSLRLGEFAAWISLGLWIVAGPIYPWALWRDGKIEGADWMHFIASLTLCGLIASAYPFFGISCLSVGSLYPTLIQGGALSPTDREFLSRLNRISRYFLTLAASVPMLSVAVLVLIGSQARGELALLAAGGVAALGIAFLLFRILQYDLETLQQIEPISIEPTSSVAL